MQSLGGALRVLHTLCMQNGPFDLLEPAKDGDSLTLEELTTLLLAQGRHLSALARRVRDERETFTEQTHVLPTENVGSTPAERVLALTCNAWANHGAVFCKAYERVYDYEPEALSLCQVAWLLFDLATRPDARRAREHVLAHIDELLLSDRGEHEDPQ